MSNKPKRYIPVSPDALRICAIMHRRPRTPWALKEVKALKALRPIPEEDFALLERYYRVCWPPSYGKNALRHDLYTLLNNWPGEVDRARIWVDKHPPKQAPPRKIIPLPKPAEEAMTEAERAQAAEEFRRLMGREMQI